MADLRRLSSRRLERRHLRFGFILVFLLLLGCTPAEDIEPRRWIAEDPEDTFEWPAGKAEALSRSEVRELTPRPWKVALGDDLRNALLAVSGDSFTRNMRIPSDGKMRLAYGLLCASDTAFRQLAPVRLEVVSERPGRDPETLWEARLDGNDQERALRWNEATIDLSGHGGRQAKISIRTSTADDPADGSACLIALGNPEVTSRATEQRALNVLVISVDTLRADRLSLYGHTRNTTPEIDAWARERGTTFATAVVQAAWTLPSHTSMFTGLEAFNHGVNFNSPAPTSLDFVAEVFRRAGYSTTAITGGGWTNPAYGFSQGFDRYAFWRGRDNENELEESLDRFLEWLSENTDRRFFALFHTNEPHGPYRPRQPYFDRFYDGPLKDRIEGLDWEPPRPNIGLVDRRIEFVWRQQTNEAAPAPDEIAELASARYDAGVAYMDAQLGRLFRRLRELDLEDRTVIVLTSDHGESLGEHGLQGHGYPYDDNILVPLIIATPGREGAGETVQTQVRSMDITPTLLELAGLPPLEGIDGQSLVPLMQGEESTVGPEAWSYTPKGNWGVALRVGNELKYIYNDSPWAGLRGRESLYFVEDDPAERRDMVEAAEGAREAELLRKRVQARMSKAPGFRIRFNNPTTERLSGRLRGGLVGPQRIKSVDMPCDCLEWIPEAALAFEVPPETSYTLLFHEIPAGSKLIVEEMSVEGRPEVALPKPVQVDLQQRKDTQALSLADGGWTIQKGYRMGQAPSLTFWWTGGVAVGARDPSAEDPELADQLRALGYLE